VDGGQGAEHRPAVNMFCLAERRDLKDPGAPATAVETRPLKPAVLHGGAAGPSCKRLPRPHQRTSSNSGESGKKPRAANRLPGCWKVAQRRSSERRGFHPGLPDDPTGARESGEMRKAFVGPLPLHGARHSQGPSAGPDADPPDSLTCHGSKQQLQQGGRAGGWRNDEIGPANWWGGDQTPGHSLL